MAITRREFIGALSAAAGGVAGAAMGSCAVVPRRHVDLFEGLPETVNDVHSQTNLTRVACVLSPRTEAETVSIVRRAIAAGTPVAVCGGRHAAGGQQFLRDQMLVDLRRLEAVSGFDPGRGTIRVGAGAFWPAVMAGIAAGNVLHGTNWGVRQKQGGCDSISIGGTIAVNAHGRCLDAAPIVQDVEALRVITPEGLVRTVDRQSDPRLFGLVVGGYGMWGVVTEVTLRLVPRQKFVLRVEEASSEDVVELLEQRRLAGAAHGDWQFAIDPASADFLTRGILTSYSVVDPGRAVTREPFVLDEEGFVDLATLAHADPSRAYAVYCDAWKARNGLVDWSDSWQVSEYLPDYHKAVDRRVSAAVPGTEVLSEFYTPRSNLPEFLRRVSGHLRGSGARLIYGVVRLIRRDGETFLNWATEDQACVIFNLHADHSDAGLASVREQLNGIAQIAVELQGRFYLTYGRFADRAQLLRAYPQLPEWLRLKERHDPRGLLQSDWYRWLTSTLGR